MKQESQKQKVSWTLDGEAVEIVRQVARQIAQETGVKVSESAAANKLIKLGKIQNDLTKRDSHE